MKKQYITKVTAVRALEMMDTFLVKQISFTSQLEPTARALGQQEAYMKTRKAFEMALRRAKSDIKKIEKEQKVEFQRADISHVSVLSK